MNPLIILSVEEIFKRIRSRYGHGHAIDWKEQGIRELVILNERLAMIHNQLDRIADAMEQGDGSDEAARLRQHAQRLKGLAPDTT